MIVSVNLQTNGSTVIPLVPHSQQYPFFNAVYLKFSKGTSCKNISIPMIHRFPVLGIDFGHNLLLASNFAWYCRLQTPTMSDRKAELERKKQKLELMRKERQEKERLRKLKEVSTTS